MHLGNGAITPECGVFALSAAAVGAGAAWYTLRGTKISRQQAATAGALGAAVFAAQMLNVSVPPWGSAHLVGGVLMAWVLGPPRGLLTMAAILLVQALLFGDGGALALGANIVNMGVLPAMLVAMARPLLRNARPVFSAVALGAVSCLSILLAAGLVVGEVALFRSAGELEGLSSFAGQMLAAHAVIGLLEAGITLGAVALLARTPRPSLDTLCLSRRQAAVVGAAALAMTVLCWPQFGLISSLPDAYETAVERAANAGHAIGGIETADRFTGASARAQSMQTTWVSLFADHVRIVPLLATVLTGGLAWLVASSTATIACRGADDPVGV